MTLHKNVRWRDWWREQITRWHPDDVASNAATGPSSYSFVRRLAKKELERRAALRGATVCMNWSLIESGSPGVVRWSVSQCGGDFSDVTSLRSFEEGGA